MTTGPSFTPGRGIEAMKAASEDSARGGGGGGFIKRLNLAEGESTYLRFISTFNEMITVKCHSGVPTKDAPTGVDPAKWPRGLTAVCRYDKAFGGFYKDCYICDNKIASKQYGRPIKASPKTFSVAVLRKEHNGTMIDVPREYTVKGEDGTDKAVRERALVVVEQAQMNFWDNLRPYFMKYGTPGDRDYQITRQGKEKDTKYIVFVEDKDPNLNPDTESWGVYAKAMAEQGLKLDDYVQSLASDEFYAKYFIPTGAAVPGVRATVAQKADADDRLAALRDSLAPAGQSASANDPWATPATVGAGVGDPWGSSADTPY